VAEDTEVTGGATILIESDVVAVDLLASVISKAAEKVPAAVGVPLMTPVDGFRDNPGGKDPDEMLQEYGAKPPVTTIEPE
jgi:hypothetical protein